MGVKRKERRHGGVQKACRRFLQALLETTLLSFTIKMLDAVAQRSRQQAFHVPAASRGLLSGPDDLELRRKERWRFTEPFCSLGTTSRRSPRRVRRSS